MHSIKGYFICLRVCLSARLSSVGLEEIPSLPNTHLPRCWAPSGQKSGRAPLTRVARAHAGEAQGHGVRGAAATGSGTSCSPPLAQKKERGAEAEPVGRRLFLRGNQQPPPPPQSRKRHRGSWGPGGPGAQEGSGCVWGGALHILLRSLAFTPGAVGTGKGCWQENDGVGFAFQKVEGWLAAGRAAQWPKGW